MKTVKLSAAAVVLFAAVIVVQMHLTAKAFAIEKTAQAIGQLSSLYVAGVHVDEDGRTSEIQIWTRVHSQDDSRSGDFREEVKDARISVVSEKDNTTWRWFPQKNELQVMSGLQNSVKPFWPDGNFFLELRAGAKQWQEVAGSDENGRPCVVVTCTYEMERLPDRLFEFWIQFDTESMLPTRLNIRDFVKGGKPQEYRFDTIQFNQPLDDKLFGFQTPQNASVIDLR